MLRISRLIVNNEYAKYIFFNQILHMKLPTSLKRQYSIRRIIRSMSMQIANVKDNAFLGYF